MCAQLIRPGLKFEVSPRPPPVATLQRTASTYQYGDKLELWPKSNEVYIICKDLTVQSVYEPEKPIGWELLEENDTWGFRVTQMGFKPQPCHVRFVGSDPNPPEGGRGTGTRVLCAMYSREEAFAPQEAIIIEFEEDGEPEVSSPECPEPPRKMSNPFFSESQ
jgi:hypothetical protein